MIIVTEEALLAEVLRLTELHGCITHHCNQAFRCTGDGLPDLIVCAPYGLLLAELKTDYGVLSSAQVTWKHTLLAAGAQWRLWRPQELHSGLIERQLIEIAYPPAQAA